MHMMESRPFYSSYINIYVYIHECEIKVGTWKDLVAGRYLRLILIMCTLSNIKKVFFLDRMGLLSRYHVLSMDIVFLRCLYALRIVECLSLYTDMIVIHFGEYRHATKDTILNNLVVYFCEGICLKNVRCILL